MGRLVKVDERGRLTLPLEARKRLKIGSLVRIEEKSGRLEILPVRDRLQKLKGSAKARISAEGLDELAERIATGESMD